jgi:hypothetical protein
MFIIIILVISIFFKCNFALREDYRCDNKYCFNNGGCILYNNETFCTCTKDYTGAYCEIIKHDCMNDIKYKCNNKRSDCIDGEYCACKLPYYGANCSQMLNCKQLEYTCGTSTCIDTSDGPRCVEPKFFDHNTKICPRHRSKRGVEDSLHKSMFSAYLTTVASYILGTYFNGKVREDECTVRYIIELKFFEEGLWKALLIVLCTIIACVVLLCYCKRLNCNCMKNRYSKYSSMRRN